VSLLVGVMDAQVAQFRELSSAGIDFGGSLFTLTARAAEAALPLDVFNKTIANNASTLSVAFGTAEQGASMFAKVSGQMMANNGKELAALGFSISEIANNSVSYIEILQRNGQLEGKSTTAIVNGSMAYNLELDKLSKATGISRKTLDEANLAAARDLRTKLALQALTSNNPDMAKAVTAKIEELKKVDPSGQLAAGFADMIATGGRAITKESQNFALAMQKSGVDASQMTRDLYTGQVNSVQNMNKSFDQAAESNQKISESNRILATVSLTQGRTNVITASAAMGAMRTTSQKAVEDAAAAQATIRDQAKTEPTRKLAGIDQDLVVAQNNFKMGIIETGTLISTTSTLLNTGAQAALGASKSFVDMGTVGKTTMLGIGAALTTISSILPSLGTVATGVAGAVGGAGVAAASAVGGAGVAAATATKVEGGAAKVAMSVGKRYLVPMLAVGGAITYALWPDDKPPEVMPMPTPDTTSQNAQALATAATLSNMKFPDSVGASIDASVIKLKSLSDAVKITTSSFSDLDNVSLNKLNASLDKLNTNILKLNETPADTGASKSAAVATNKDTSTAVIDKLDQLNSTMMAMVNHQSASVDYLSKTAKNTRQSVGNMIG
jgi:hypothetical protein